MFIHSLGPLVVLLVVLEYPSGREPGANEEGIVIAGALPEVLAKIGREANQPIGLVWDRHQTFCNAGIVFRSGDLYGALNAVTRRCPNFTWRRDGRSVFLLPRQKVKTFLDVKAAAYTLTEASRMQAADEIVALPEVKAWMKANNISAEQAYYIHGINPVITHDLSVHLKAVRVHDILDALARATGTMTWEIMWHSDSALAVYPW
jgi:hypothetical protein